MAIHSRKLFQFSNHYTINSTTTTVDLCSFQCRPGSDGYSYCFANCTSISPPPPPPHASLQTHFMPYLIAVVCFLGVAFLLISTSTILLRNRWGISRQRRSVHVMSVDRNDDDNDRGDGGAVVDYPVWNIVTVGLQQSVIDRITAFRYEKGVLVEGNDCSVCLTEFEEGEDLRLLPKCSHAFHVCCIDTWLRSHKNCPLCRAPVVNEGVVSSRDLSPVEETMIEDSEDREAGIEIRDGIGERLDVGDESENVHMRSVSMIVEILEKNHELRGVLSDLGETRRAFGGDVTKLRRSVSMDAAAASVISNAVSKMVVISVAEDEGTSSCSDEEKFDVDDEGEKDTAGVEECSGSRASSSVGCSSHKGSFSMKRSISSSSGKFFSSFRRSKSQVSSL
ncbi:hypothetical protein Droror1_Dr00011158 [Drosera rotundifolia]